MQGLDRSDATREHPVSLGAAALVWSAIIGVAIGLRLWGITWGSGRIDLNPDERLVLRIASGLTWEDPDPNFFSYSGFVFHQSFLTFEVLRLVGIELVEFGRLLMHRSWSVFWGVLTVVLIFHIARSLGSSRRAGFMAAALMAIMPLHVWETHFGTTDSPLLFLMMGALLVSVRAYEQPTWRHTLLAGVLTGFAIGTKYPGAFAAVAFVVAIGLATQAGGLASWRTAVARAAGFGGAVIVASALVSPYSYVHAFQAAAHPDPRAQSSFAAFLFEFGAMQEGVFGFDLKAPGWQYHPYIYELGAAWPFSLGIALHLLVLAGIVTFMRKIDGRRLVVLAFIVAYFGVTGSWQFVPLRYSLPVLALLVVMGAVFLDDLIVRRRLVGVAVGSLVAVYTLALTTTTTHRFTSDTRLQAAAWGNEWLNPGSIVLMVQTRSPYAYLPQLDRAKLSVQMVQLRSLYRTVQHHRKRLGKGGPGAPTVYLCASSMDYVRYYRSGVPESIKAWNQLRANPVRFRPIKAFEADFLNQSFYARLDPMFGAYFVSPRIEFYEFVQ